MIHKLHHESLVILITAVDIHRILRYDAIEILGINVSNVAQPGAPFQLYSYFTIFLPYTVSALFPKMLQNVPGMNAQH